MRIITGNDKSYLRALRRSDIPYILSKRGGNVTWFASPLTSDLTVNGATPPRCKRKQPERLF